MTSQHSPFWLPIRQCRCLPNYLLLPFALCAALGTSLAQELPRTVIGSSGDYYDNLLFGSLHFTVGEIAVARFENNIELGEGFHRSYYDLLVDAQEILPTSWEVTVCPNPTTEQVRFRWSTKEQLTAQLYDTNGRLILQQAGILQEGQMDMSPLPAGTYLLRLQDLEGRTGSFQILKVNR